MCGENVKMSAQTRLRFISQLYQSPEGSFRS